MCVRGVRVECPLDSLHFIVYTSFLLCIFNYDRRRQRINGLMGVVVPVLRGGVVYMVVFFFLDVWRRNSQSEECMDGRGLYFM